MAHPGWPWVDETTAVALHKGNVYWEMSGWAPKYFPGNLKVDMRGRLQDKIMFGSDYPSMPYARILEGMAGAGLQGRSDGKNLPQERRKDPRTMKTTVATLSLLVLAACATTQENEGPPTAFRLTSPGMPDNSMLPPKAAGNFAKNPNCTGQNVSPRARVERTRRTRRAASPSSGTTRPAAPGSASRTR